MQARKLLTNIVTESKAAMHDVVFCLDNVKHSQKLAGSLYSFILPTFVHLTDRLAQLCTLCMSSNLGMPSEEKVRMRISCGPNQLHLIHGKPVGSVLFSHCLPPPPPPLPQHSTTPSSTTLYTDSVTVDSTAPTIVPLHNTAHMTRVGVFRCTYSDTAQSQVDYPDTFANWKTTALKLQNKTTNK